MQGHRRQDVDKLISSINANPRLSGSASFSGKVYGDEPILRRASQMNGYLPQRYRDMKGLARAMWQANDMQRPSETRLFVEQARFMADWEDDFPYKGEFKRYYPTYSMMNDQQLRGYFSWRTKLRHGQLEEAPLSFAFVHVYELLNGVGGVDALDCLRKAKAFWEDYRIIAPQMDRYLKYWLRDFVVYYNLPFSELDGVVDTSAEEALIALKHAEAQVAQVPVEVPAFALFDEEARLQVFNAFAKLSAYNAARSKFFQEHENDVAAVVCAVFAGLCRHYAKRRKRGLCESTFGISNATPHRLFEAAVFYEPKRHADCRYRINEVHSYSCKNGTWTSLRGYRSLVPDGDLGVILKTIDSRMRQAYGYPDSLKTQAVPKYVDAFIAEAISGFAAYKREQQRRQVVIDRSALSGIRSAAATTREQLLIDEERGEGEGFQIEAEPEAPVQESVPNPDPVPIMPHAPELEQSGASCDLTAEELSALRCLLKGEPVPVGSVPEDLLVDAINEKLFDLLGDTALEYGDGGPQFVEDYREDIEEALKS